MARAPVLGGGTLNPFGGAGIDFGAFDIGGTDRESRLILTRIEVRWEAGEATDDEYLAALRAYSTTLARDSSEWLNNEARVKALDYRIKREIIVSGIEGGTKELSDLLTFDRAGLNGLVQDSAEYRSRLNTLRNTQAQLLSDEEDPVVEKYGNGKMTTAQLKSWYQQRLADPRFDNNDELTESLTERIRELDTRIVEERDAATIDKYSQGKMSPQSFIAYATQARGRYKAGTTDYREWSERIDSARDQSTETALLYRYDLSQQYAQLQAFVASNSKGLRSGVSKGRTSTSKRVVLGADGRWKTVTQTKHTPGKPIQPSDAEVKAYQNRQIEVADAKRQMAEISKKLGRVGGAIGTSYMIGWYTKQLDRYARGSSEWYAVQGKLDSLNDRKHEEAVMARQGIRISYPSSTSGGGGGGSAGGTSSSSRGAGGGSSGATTRGSAGGGGGGITLDKFMHAIASVESGGRYNARNSSSGAYGKYQIMPSNWPSWAQKAGLSANAPQTPENQEKVARAAFQRLWGTLKDWRLVAIAWHSGASVARDLSRIGPNGRNYVNLVSQKLGQGSVTVSNGRLVGGGGGAISNGSGGYSGSASPASGGGGSGGYSPGAPAKAGKPKAAPAGPLVKGKGPLQVITGVSAPPMRPGFDVHRQRTGFPVNLDGEAFKKFYAQYQDAFESGAESFSVNSPGGEVHYFIGDDPLERIDGMKQLDQLRIELFQTRMVAYAGTPSEITAANQFDDAIEDAARNKFLVLSMGNNERTARTVPGRASNPLAEGVEMLQERKAGIDAHIKAAETAMKRGDLDAAWGHYQLAAGLRASAERALQTYASLAEKKIADIERRYGVSLSEALGKGGGVVGTDLEDLLAGGSELEESLAKGNQTLAELKKFIKLDSSGKVVYDDSGTGGQLLLNDDYIRVFKNNGQVEFKSAPKGVDNNGKISRDLEGLVKMDVKIGTRTVEAYGEYKVANVGVIIGKDGSPIPIKGKVIQYTDPNTGRQAMVMENPFNPGQWSTSPIRYKAPAAGTFSVVPGPGGGSVLQFTSPKYGASTFTLELDPKTGLYQMYQSKPGGLFGVGAIDNQPLGPLAPGTFAADVWGSVWKRDLTGLSGDALYWATMDNPVIGFTAKEHKQWTSSGLSSFVPNAARKQLQQQYGDLFSGTKASTPGTYAFSEKGGGAARQAQQFGGFGGPRQTSTNAPTSFGGFGGPRLTDPALDRAKRMPITPRAENEAGIAKNLRATLPKIKPLPTSPGGFGGKRLGPTPTTSKSRLTEREEAQAEKRRATAAKKKAATPKTSSKKRATSSKRPALKPLPKKKPTTRRPSTRRATSRSPSITSRADRSGALR